MENIIEEKTPEQKKAEKYAKIKLTMLRRHGPDFYKKIAAKGGKNGDNRPFRDQPGLASEAGQKSAKIRKSDKPVKSRK